jgi:outer membrane scaffolding protein for murein synthesis (MipA/OmpV family)
MSQTASNPHLPFAALGLGLALAASAPAWADSATDEAPPPQLEIGVGLTNTPGWLGDNRAVTHGTAWANAEYTTRDYGRLQLNGGSLTMDPSVNWDPWVKDISSFGFMIGYHNNPLMGEDRSSRLPGSVAGFDVGVQAVVSVAGVPLFAQVRKSVAADQGWIMVAGSYLPIHPVKTLTVAFLPTARWLNSTQSQVCFGAPALPGSAPYSARAGFQDVSLEVVVDWQFYQQLHWVSSVSQRWLTGSAAQTPLTASTDQTGFTSGVSIHF